MSILDDESDIMNRADDVVLYTIQPPMSANNIEKDVKILKQHLINYTEAWYNVILDVVTQFDEDKVKFINIGQVLQILKENYWEYKLVGGLLTKINISQKVNTINMHISNTLVGVNLSYYRLNNFPTFIISLFDCYSILSRESYKHCVSLYKDDILYNEYRDRIWNIIEHRNIKIKRTL